MATPVYNPRTTDISNITQANPAVVTTTANHGYITGYQVRIVLPINNFGMQPLNFNVYTIIVLSSNSFALNVDSSNFNAFSVGSNPQVPQCQYVGEPAITLVGAFKNVLPPIGGGL